MKGLRLLVVYITTTLLILTIPLTAYAIPAATSDKAPGNMSSEVISSTPAVFINNELIEFSAPPVIKKETLLVPYYDLAESLGLGLVFDSKEKVLHFFGNTGELELAIDGDIAYLNEQPKELVCPAQIINNTIYVPLLFVANSMGIEISWDMNIPAAFIRIPENEPQGALSINVIDKATRTPVYKAFVAVLETNELSRTDATGKSKAFLLDVPSNQNFELYSLFITAEGYNPIVYRHIPVAKNDSVIITVQLNQKTDKILNEDSKDSIKYICNYYNRLYKNEMKNDHKALIGIKNLPSDDLIEWVKNTKKAGVFRRDTSNYRNYVICLGEKPTGGYQVIIRDAACFPDKWIIDIEFSSPTPGDIVTQAITYPRQTVSIPLDYKPVIFRLNNNGKFVYLPIIQ